MEKYLECNIENGKKIEDSQSIKEVVNDINEGTQEHAKQKNTVNELCVK